MSIAAGDIQDLSAFRVPQDFRGRPAWKVQLWWLVQSFVFRPSPQVLFAFRRSLLRLFGARVGRRVRIRASATFTFPWRVSIGDDAWIGDDVVVYSLGEVTIGNNAVVSQRSYLCAATHDYTAREFPIQASPIVIGDQAWLATDVFVAPGVTVGQGAVVGARSSVFDDIPPLMVAFGSPAQPRYPREVRGAGGGSSESRR